jgi:hypothetical protein
VIEESRAFNTRVKIMTMAERMTDWFSRVLNWKLRGNETAVHIVTEQERLTRALGRFEPYVIKLQRILIWERPFVSILCVLVVNLLFW